MKYQAVAKYIRVSPRKAQLVADSVRHLAPEEAIATLRQLRKSASRPIADVIASAIANAKMKGADVASLTLTQLEVTRGPSLRRWRPVSRGMAHQYKKRMSHVRVVVTDEKGDTRGKGSA